MKLHMNKVYYNLLSKYNRIEIGENLKLNHDVFNYCTYVGTSLVTCDNY